MSEKMTLEQFNSQYEIDRKSSGVKAIPKSNVKKAHKFKAEATERDGIKFPSKKEAKTYDKLLLMERAGAIANLKVNAALKGEDKLKYIFQTEPFKMWYEPDFEYDDLHTKTHIVVDAKGVRTPEYKRKKRLMKQMFDIDVTEY